MTDQVIDCLEALKAAVPPAPPGSVDLHRMLLVVEEGLAGLRAACDRLRMDAETAERLPRLRAEEAAAAARQQEAAVWIERIALAKSILSTLLSEMRHMGLSDPAVTAADAFLATEY